MEIRLHKVGDYYANIVGNTSTPWYVRHKRKICTVLILTGVILLIAILFISLRCSNCETSSSIEDSLQWDGKCSQNISMCPSSFQKNPPLLLISLDGFRFDYLSLDVSPTLKRLAECGVKADFMLPVYPSKTFPNHYSIVTGLYPYMHGIIDNNMYDNDINKTFKLGKLAAFDSRWWLKEPIWITAQKQGKSAACFFWPGSDVKINGSRPHIYQPYDGSVPYETRVDQVLEWLTLDKRPDFMTLYFDEPDTSGHRHGPNSPEVKKAVRKVDSMLDRFFAGLQARNLTNCVNIIIVSDHGMSGVDCDRVVDTRKYINTSDFHFFSGAFGRLKPKQNTTSVDEVVSKLQCQDSHMRAYRKEELPIRMHYVDNSRIEPIILDIDQRYSLVDRNVKKGDWKCTGGTHGYDNLFPDMRGIFFAYGPSFKRNISIQPILNIELYELMCEIININPQPNNGTKGSLHEILKQPRDLQQQRPNPSPPVAEMPDKSQSLTNLSNCPCFQTQNRDDKTKLENKKSYHLPFGVPVSSDNTNNLLLLLNDDYILAYDTKLNLPLWASFTLNQSRNALNEKICWSGDARVQKAKCTSTDGFIQRPLYPPGFSYDSTENQAFLVSNAVLKSTNHAEFIEREMYYMIEKKVSDKGPVNVLIGPTFDPSSDQLRQNLNSTSDSTVVPSHIFVIMTWCSTSVELFNECDPRNLDIQSFLLPNYPFPNNCEKPEDMIMKNVARVVDIETLAGLTLYNELTTSDSIRLRTSVNHFSLESRTFI